MRAKWFWTRICTISKFERTLLVVHYDVWHQSIYRQTFLTLHLNKCQCKIWNDLLFDLRLKGWNCTCALKIFLLSPLSSSSSSEACRWKVNASPHSWGALYWTPLVSFLTLLRSRWLTTFTSSERGYTCEPSGCESQLIYEQSSTLGWDTLS